MKAVPFLHNDGEASTHRITRARAAYLLRAARSRRSANVLNTQFGYRIVDARVTLSHYLP